VQIAKQRYAETSFFQTLRSAVPEYGVVNALSELHGKSTFFAVLYAVFLFLFFMPSAVLLYLLYANAALPFDVN